MSVIAIQTNFTVGEVDPLIRARIDTTQYYSALQQARNVVIQPQGGASRRPGLKYVAEITGGSPASGVRMMSVETSVDETYVLVIVNNRIYIYKDQVLQTNINGSGNDYLTTTIASAQLSELYWTMSFDTILFFHEDMATKKLSKGATSTTWTISDITWDYVPKYRFTLTSSNPATTLTPSAVDGVINLTAGVATWSAADVDQYVNATNGIGRARITKYTSTTVVQAYVEVPFGSTAAIASGDWELEAGYADAWSAGKGYPRTGAFHEGRLWIGGSRDLPTTVWGSKVGSYWDFNPGQAFDDDPIEFTIDNDNYNALVGTVSGRNLQFFTTAGEFYIPQSLGDPITPGNVAIKVGTQRGSRPGTRQVSSDGGTLFLQRQGKALREFLFSDTENSYISNNISMLSSHLLNEPGEIVYRKATSTREGDLLVIRNTGDTNLAVFTLLRTQNVIAPAAWSTDGTFKALAVDLDEIYAVVLRVVNGSDRYFIEVFDDNYVTDCAVKATVPNYGTTLVNGAGQTGTSLAVDGFTLQPQDGDTFSLTHSAANWGTPLVNGGGQTGETLTTDGWTVQPRQGDYFTLAGNTYRVDAATTLSGSASTLTITPDLVSIPSDNAALTMTKREYTISSATVLSGTGSTLTITPALVAAPADNAAVTMTGVKRMSGLSHLTGETVSVRADDATRDDEVVASGQITISDNAAEYIEAGLGYTVTMQTMPVETRLQSGNIQGFKKRIVDVTAIVNNTQALTINDKRVSFRRFGSSNLNDPPDTVTGIKKIRGLLGYSYDASITVTQDEALPMTLLALAYRVSVGQQ